MFKLKICSENGFKGRQLAHFSDWSVWLGRKESSLMLLPRDQTLSPCARQWHPVCVCYSDWRWYHCHTASAHELMARAVVRPHQRHSMVFECACVLCLLMGTNVAIEPRPLYGLNELILHSPHLIYTYTYRYTHTHIPTPLSLHVKQFTSSIK